jgi:hypothetical protein
MVAMALSVPLGAQFAASVDQIFNGVHEICFLPEVRPYLAAVLKKLGEFLPLQVFTGYISGSAAPWCVTYPNCGDVRIIGQQFPVSGKKSP